MAAIPQHTGTATAGASMPVVAERGPSRRQAKGCVCPPPNAFAVPALAIPHGRLRPFREIERDCLFGLLTNPLVRDGLRGSKACDQPAAQVLETHARATAGRGGLWVIETLQDSFAGVVGIKPEFRSFGLSSMTTGGVEVIVALKPQYWGEGLAGLALSSVISFAAREGFCRMTATVESRNVRACKLMERSGFNLSPKAWAWRDDDVSPSIDFYRSITPGAGFSP